jgi:hypothetical protein
MVACVLSGNIHNILVVGPIYNQIDKLNYINTLVSKYDYIIFNGGLCYTIDNINYRISKMNELLKNTNIIYNLDDQDLQSLQFLSDQNILSWILNKSNVVIVKFNTQTTTIITSGGLTPTMNIDYILDNLEISFLTKVNGVNWHELYSGLCGYVISNKPLTTDFPKFYPFSMQIGNKFNDTYTNVYAQEVNGFGIKNTILL